MPSSMVARINSQSLRYNKRGELFSAASVRTNMVDMVEQVAIAIAMLDPKPSIIYTDSCAVVRAFASGLIAKEAALKKKSETDSVHHITWCPAHMGDDVFRAAWTPMRLLTAVRENSRAVTGMGPLRVLRLLGIVTLYFHFMKSGHITQGRCRVMMSMMTTQASGDVFYLPIPKSGRAQSRTPRKLQTGSYPSRGFLSRLHTEIDPHCPDCGAEFCTLARMLWKCPVLDDFSNSEDWEKAITSTKQEDQSKAVQRARERAERHGLPAPTWD